MRFSTRLQLLLPALVSFLVTGSVRAQERTATYPEMPTGAPPTLSVSGAEASSAEKMQAYDERIPGTSIAFGLAPVPGGTFTMGSPAEEQGRRSSEGPTHEVRVAPFWMGTHEVTWEEYHPFMLRLDQERRRREKADPAPQDSWADAVSRPTPPYIPMDFEMGTEGRPAVCMTQFAAKQYTKWLSMKTGRFYRLPTEAEWEYACRAGTTTVYSFGDDPAQLEAHAWFYGNSDDAYHPVGSKAPNAWGLFDMHGNVAEWVLDRYDKDFYGSSPADDPLAWPAELYPRVVRGGSWDDDAKDLRSAARRWSRKSWKVQDPQLPKSIWYHTDASFVGFRVVRPLVPPTPEERARYWEADVDSIRRVQQRQRRGER